jgi:alpha-mannosidase
MKKEQEKLKFDWPVYTGDFFPYNGFHVAHYWTGYFTSRPNFKKLIRDFTGYTLATDTFFALEFMQKFKRNNLTDSKIFNRSHSVAIRDSNELVATDTHHDTITGTSPSFVIMNETEAINMKVAQASRLISNSLKQKIL